MKIATSELARFLSEYYRRQALVLQQPVQFFLDARVVCRSKAFKRNFQQLVPGLEIIGAVLLVQALGLGELVEDGVVFIYGLKRELPKIHRLDEDHLDLGVFQCAVNPVDDLLQVLFHSDRGAVPCGNGVDHPATTGSIEGSAAGRYRDARERPRVLPDTPNQNATAFRVAGCDAFQRTSNLVPGADECR